jgi:anti-sigma factor ChrR (cupin superfamily)
MDAPHRRTTVSTTSHDTHLSAERIQALLDGALPSRERRRAEEHLASCGRCASEVARWRAVFEELDELPRLVPHEGFRARVMAEVEIPEPAPLAARARAFVRRLVPTVPGFAHPPDEDLQDLAEGTLPDRVAVRVRRHVDGCPSCAGELAAWQALLGRLDGLERLDPGEEFSREVMATWRLEQALDGLGHLEPGEGFAARVMAGVRIPEPAPAPAPSRIRDRLLAAARSLAPRTRRAWAALSGVAVTPVVTVALVVWAVFSSPAVTPGALLAFTGWKAAELAAAGWTAVSGWIVESAGGFLLWEALASLFGAPGTVAAAALAVAAGTLVSLWVLYRNLIATHAVDGRYARAQS